MRCMQRILEQPKLILEREYAERRRRNPRYSLRSFARALDVSCGRLSQWLSSKRAITPKQAAKISERLAMDPSASENFLNFVNQSYKLRRRPELWQSTLNTQFSDTQKNLDMDAFDSIAEPVHYDILSLIETTGFQSSLSWISQRLNRPHLEVRSALERLERIGLILVTRTANGEIENITLTGQNNLTTSQDIQSRAIRRAHKENLKNIEASLEEVNVLLRDISSITVAANLAKLPQAKEIIKRFRRELAAVLEDGDKEEVYRLFVSLTPVTQLIDSKIGERK